MGARSGSIDIQSAVRDSFQCSLCINLYGKYNPLPACARTIKHVDLFGSGCGFCSLLATIYCSDECTESKVAPSEPDKQSIFVLGRSRRSGSSGLFHTELSISLIFLYTTSSVVGHGIEMCCCVVGWLDTLGSWNSMKEPIDRRSRRGPRRDGRFCVATTAGWMIGATQQVPNSAAAH